MKPRTWVRRTVTVLLLAVVLNAGISISLRGRRAHHYLTARLAESFGRPLDVGRFDFSFLDGLRLNARQITVGEDPRFGREYFLRAEQLTAGLRWGRFFAGHFEFGTLSFTRPSLNLVRTSDGRWNIESWLPTAKPPDSGRSSSSVPREPAGRLYRIEVDGGRINFKSDADKRPFALVDVSGSVEQESAGRWRLDLEAHPMRAGVTLQQSGTLRVSGRIAGTSARLQPAELYAKWVDASIADMLRLASGKDYGVRGRLTLELNALSQSGSVPGWTFALTGQATHVHRWDLAGRLSDPAVNVRAEAQWDRRDPRLKIGAISAEGPHSRLYGTGEVIWQSDIEPELQFQMQRIDFADLFAWYRAFQPGVAEQTSLDGYLSGQFGVSGWPPRLDRAEFTSTGVTLSVAGLRGPILSGEVAGKFQDGWLGVDPLVIHLPTARAAEAQKTAVGEPVAKNRQKNATSDEANTHLSELLKLSARVSAKENRAAIALEGGTRRAEDLLVVMKAIGYPANPNWTLTGPVSLNLRKDMRISSGTSAVQGAIAGWIELQGSRLRVAGLNLPLELADARLEWKDGERHVLLRSAHGLGAQWTGTLRQQAITPSRSWEPWEFDLSADHVSAVDLDRWLGPRARRGFLERLLPGLAAGAGLAADRSAGDEPVKNIRAHGHIAIEELQIAPLRVRKLKGSVKIDGRTVRLEEAQAEFYGGNLSGSFEANLKTEPEYRADAEVERVNLSALAAATATLRERFGGFASARIHLTARGIGRDDLAKSLEGHVKFTGWGTQVRGLDLKAALAARRFHTGIAQWPLAEGAFVINAGGIRITRLRLKDGATDVLAEGTIDLSHALDFQVRAVEDSAPNGLAITPARAVHLTGTLEAPRLERVIPRVEAKPASN